MNEKQALAKARKVFGKNGHVRRQDKPTMMVARGGPNKGQPVKIGGTHAVGELNCVGGICFFSVRGDGMNWDEAFADYERKLARDRETYAAK